MLLPFLSKHGLTLSITHYSVDDILFIDKRLSASFSSWGGQAWQTFNSLEQKLEQRKELGQDRFRLGGWSFTPLTLETTAQVVLQKTKKQKEAESLWPYSSPLSSSLDFMALEPLPSGLVPRPERAGWWPIQQRAFPTQTQLSWILSGKGWRPTNSEGKKPSRRNLLKSGCSTTAFLTWQKSQKLWQSLSPGFTVHPSGCAWRCDQPTNCWTAGRDRPTKDPSGIKDAWKFPVSSHTRHISDQAASLDRPPPRMPESGPHEEGSAIKNHQEKFYFFNFTSCWGWCYRLLKMFGWKYPLQSINLVRLRLSCLKYFHSYFPAISAAECFSST